MKARYDSSGEDLNSVMGSVKIPLTTVFSRQCVRRNAKRPRQLSMSMAKSEVDARVVDYFHQSNTIVKTNGLAALFSEEEGTKKKCKVLLNCLPSELKTRVKNVRFPATKSSVSTLFKIGSEKALEIDREEKALSKNKRRSYAIESKPESATRSPKRARTVMDKRNTREPQLQTAPRAIFRTNSEENRPKRQLELLAIPNCNDGDDNEETPDVAARENDAEDIRVAMLQRAQEEGFPVEKLDRLRTILYAHDVWRLVLGNDPPAKVEPMRVKVKTGYGPTRQS
ncbi:unnamed protein product [Phytophthora lilii]|uniref:Unnamed protein product n=1 Tax=Phytophthora lilii TaxID=2077276 RepID=A0A9W6X2A8_9STRA|nr:unnamed protein product [Phytophthora lilii]